MWGHNKFPSQCLISNYRWVNTNTLSYCFSSLLCEHTQWLCVNVSRDDFQALFIPIPMCHAVMLEGSEHVSCQLCKGLNRFCPPDPLLKTTRHKTVRVFGSSPPLHASLSVCHEVHGWKWKNAWNQHVKPTIRTQEKLERAQKLCLLEEGKSQLFHNYIRYSNNHAVCVKRQLWKIRCVSALLSHTM